MGGRGGSRQEGREEELKSCAAEGGGEEKN